MQTYFRRKAFAAVSLAVLCAVPAAVALYFYHAFPLSPLPPGHPMPPLVATSLEGKAFVQDTMPGKKFLLVFFTPACSHCRKELTNLDELLPKYSKQLAILGISLDNLEATRTMAAELNLKFRVVVADRNRLDESYRITILPAIFCFDESRRLKKFFSGEHSPAIDEHLIEDFISSSSAQ